jgi:cytochrome o ubiquinol oxidase subunit 3
MTAAVMGAAANAAGHGHGHDHDAVSEQGPSSRRAIIGYGFWLFLLSDIIVFSGFFAAYAVLSKHTFGGPDGAQLFDRGYVFWETTFLLLSSFTCGLFYTGMEMNSKPIVYAFMGLTFLFGAAFIGMEVHEFRHLIEEGNGPQRSAFLTAFFSLVGLHGCHVTAGLCWLAVSFAQVATLGLRPLVTRRLVCFCLFWHALDLVWIGVFTIVYLGAR